MKNVLPSSLTSTLACVSSTLGVKKTGVGGAHFNFFRGVIFNFVGGKETGCRKWPLRKENLFFCANFLKLLQKKMSEKFENAN